MKICMLDWKQKKVRRVVQISSAERQSEEKWIIRESYK